MIGKLQEESRAHSQVLETYRTLTDEIGPRLTGSPAFKRAVDWTRDRFTQWGMSNVTVESWPFGRGWTLEKLTLEMTQPRYFPLEGYPEAWSPSTRGLLNCDADLPWRQDCGSGQGAGREAQGRDRAATAPAGGRPPHHSGPATTG